MKVTGGGPAYRLGCYRRGRHCLEAVLSLLLCLVAVDHLPAQVSPPTAHANEPVVGEEIATEVVFEATGKGSIRTRARLLIGNESGVQQAGQLAFPYVSGQESLTLDFVRVTRPDGSVQEVSQDSIEDIAAPFSAQFPVYSDLRLVHVIAPPIRPGDVLEYQQTREISNPVAPGKLFFEHRFERQAVVLQETLTVEVPNSVPLSLRHAEDLAPEKSERENSTVLSWTTSNPEARSLILDDETENLLPIPDVEISSFTTWNEIGSWYQQLAAGRAAPTAEIREKAQALTENLESDEEKVRAIYNFVAREFRYLALLLGTTAYQPHHATEVLNNGYGDCKDKHTLLESLLAAVGIASSPVVVSATRALSPEVPSPLQFDHVITRVELEDGRALWLDSTIQVSPFGYLMPVLRGKEGLWIPPSGPSPLVPLPDSLPFESLFEANVEATIDDAGDLTGQVDYRSRGDREFLERTSLFSLPPSEWSNLADAVQMSMTVSGDVSNPEFSSAAETDEPLTLQYEVVASDFLDPADLASQEIEPMLPNLRLPEVPEADGKEGSAFLALDGPHHARGRFVARLPQRFDIQVPVDVHLVRDFAEYRAQYKAEDGELIAERSLRQLVPSVPAERFGEYAAFRKAIQEDQKQRFTVSQSQGSNPAKRSRPKDIEALYAQGKQAIDDKRWQDAIAPLQAVVEAEPQHPLAWNHLGRALGNVEDYEAALVAVRRQLEVAPYHEYARNNLGWILKEMGDLEGAEAAYRAQLEQAPLNQYANNNLGKLLAKQDRCTDAIPVLEKSVALDKGHNWNRYRLGRCLLMEGRAEEGVEWLETLIDATENTNLLLQAGRAAARNEQYESAVALFEKVVFLDSDDPDGYQYLGLALNQSGRPDEAIGVLQKYMELSPDDSEMRETLASLMLIRGDLAGAEEVASFGGEIDSEALSYLIVSLHQKGKTDEAIDKARLYLEDSPEDLEILDALGVVQLSAHKFQEAQKTFQRLIQIDPDYPGAQRWLARAYFGAMKFHLAQPHVEKALEQDPSDWEALNMMAFLEAQAGDLETAIGLLEKALANAPKPFDGEIRERLEILRSQLNN